MKKPNTARSSIQSFMNQQKLFNKSKINEDQQISSPSFEIAPNLNPNKYQSVRYGSKGKDRSQSGSREKQHNSFVNSFIVEDELEQHSDDRQMSHRQMYTPTNKQLRQDSRSQPKSVKTKPNETKSFYKQVSSANKYDFVEEDSPEKTKIQANPTLAWESQIVKSSRNYFDSCRGGALDYIGKLEGMLITDRKLLGTTIRNIKQLVKKQLQTTGQKIKEDLYLAVDEAVEFWKEQQLQICRYNEIDYMGQIFELSTQVEERMKQMTEFKVEIEHQNIWKTRASDLLTSNYEGDIRQLSKLCEKAVGQAMNSSEHYMQRKHQKIQGGAFQVRDLIKQKINYVLISLDEDHKKTRTPLRNNNKKIIDQKSPQYIMSHPPPFSTTENNSSYKRKQIFNSASKVSQKIKNSRNEQKSSYGMNNKQGYRNNDDRNRERSQTQVQDLRVEELKRRMERAQNRLRRNIQSQKRGGQYSQSDGY